jgi:outer membrane protein OmpA-like peptidoglycan-associated protein
LLFFMGSDILKRKVKGCILKIRNLSIAFSFLLLTSGAAIATPTQYGESGLISVPTTEVTERGIFQPAIWLNYSRNDGESFTLLPISLSMGISDSWEISGSYPNVLLNNQNDGSMRGFENIGIKYRFIGDAGSNFKAALSAFLRQTVSDNEDLNGLRDLGTRLIFSYRLTNAEVHLNVGYLKVDSPSGESWDNKTLFGGAVEFPVSDRLRPFVEVDGNTNEVDLDTGKEEDRIELTPGVQFYLLPYLSITGGVGFGLTDAGPDYRVIAGITFTSGAGRYVKAIPIIPGSRERYAATTVSPEELLPELLIVKEEAAEGAVPPPVGVPGVEGLEVPAAPPSPVTPPSPVAKPKEKEILAPALVREVPPVPMEPPMPVLKAMPPAPVPAAPAVEEAKEIRPEVPPIKERVERKEEVIKFAPPNYAILYFFAKGELSPYVKGVLDRVAREIKGTKRPIKKIRIEGHTDSVGSTSRNNKLSYVRAESAKAYLVKKHDFPAQVFEVKGFGEERPVASNATTEGRRENRRVEIYVHFAD